MIYNTAWLIQNIDNGIKVKFLFFWGHQKSRNGEVTPTCFSQWYESAFNVDGIKYNTAEHWMMAQKALLFDDLDCYTRICNARTPAEAKDLGRKVKNFDEQVWNKRRMEIVIQGSLHKFGQNKDLKDFLLNTKDRILVEASPVDAIWGIGLAATAANADKPSQWEGLNLLGFCLMAARDILSQSSDK